MSSGHGFFLIAELGLRISELELALDLRQFDIFEINDIN